MNHLSKLVGLANQIISVRFKLVVFFWLGLNAIFYMRLDLTFSNFDPRAEFQEFQ